MKFPTTPHESGQRMKEKLDEWRENIHRWTKEVLQREELK